MTTATAATIVGRHLEQQLLLSHLKAARSSSSRALLLRGEAGVGKSALLEVAVEQARALGFRTLLGRSRETSALPFGCLRDAVEPLIESPPPGLPIHLVANASRALESTESATEAAAGPAGTPGESLGRLVRSWAASGPALLVLEDLHLADHDTWTLLFWLLRRLDRTRCLVLGALGPLPGSEHSSAQLLERLVYEELVTVVDIDPLDADDVRALAAARLDAAADDELASLVWDASGGNPFFAQETIRALTESAAVTVRDGRATLRRHPGSLPAPSSITVLERVRRLGDDAAAVARALSVFLTFTLDRMPLLATLAGMPEARVDRAFDSLVDADVLERTDAGYRFRHAILRDTLYSSVGPAERRRLHTLVAESMRGSNRAADTFELAHHTAESAVPGDGEAAAVLERAGDLSATTSPGAAARWFGSALALVDGEPGRTRLLAKRSQALFRSSQLEDAVTVGMEALASLPAGTARGNVGSIVTSALLLLGRPGQALAVADEVLGSVPASMPRLLSRRATILLYLGRFDEASAAGAEALEAAGDDALGQNTALGMLAAIEFTRGRYADSMALLARQHEAAARGGKWPLLVSCAAAARFRALGGDLPRARSALAEAAELAHVQSAEALRSDIDLADVVVGWLGGDWGVALERVRWALLHAELHGQAHNLPLLRAVVIAILTDQGNLAAARAVPLTDPGSLGSALLSAALAAREAASGDIPAALGRLRSAADADDALGRHSASAMVLSSLARLELEGGDRAGARATGARLAAQVGAGSAPLARVQALATIALVDHDPGAAREAVALAAAHELRVEEARGHLLLAQLGVDAVASASRAEELFAAMGADPERRRAAALLRSLGVHVRHHRARAARGVLSESEMRIATLLHDGLSNREIAEAMFLSRKTVENYLSRIFQKTGCRTRVELALAYQAGRLGEQGGTPFYGGAGGGATVAP